MLIRVKVGSEILFPCRKRAGEQPLFGKQMAPRTAPSAELEEAAFMPKVVAGLQPLWRLRQKVRVVEQPCSEHRGVVFVGSSDGHRMNGFLLVDVGNAAKGAVCPMVDHSLVQDMLVEALVDTTVGGFLTDKAFDVLRKAGVQIRA